MTRDDISSLAHSKNEAMYSISGDLEVWFKDSIYQNDTVMTEQQFTETENTDIAGKNDLFGNDSKEVADKTDIQIMILTENMAAFNSEDNISDSLNIVDTENIMVSNQLFVNSQD